MSDKHEQQDHRERLKNALLALKKLQARLDAVEQARREPIAIVGMGCRLPGGGDSPEAFWRFLQAGGDAVSEVPSDRWDIDALYDPAPEAPGKISTRQGSFVGGIDRFDPQFFGIAPREAVSLDPQQRLLLEVAWEALERAGIAPDRLSGSRAGVFIGIGVDDYAQLQLRGGDPALIDAYTGTGVGLCFAAGRISYILGLQGPSLTVDTACSSSLVAVHLAVQSLRVGECDLALAGGASLVLTPEINIYLSKARALAPDGRCKTFDAAADGYGRGEGCGVVVLKRLSDAQRDGDPVLALIRGSAVNHDGPSGGLTVPNGLAQQALLRAALADAGLGPAEVGYIEAHGTGTSLGDPIELEALGAVLGQGRAQPFAVGSVKTNIGHLEAAAGVAGLIKLVLMLQHGQIPAHLHLKNPSPHIAWDALPLTVPTALTPWQPAGRRVAGVSAFGLSGTNAHVLVEEAPPAAPAPADPRPLHLLVLSARSAAALRELAGRWAERLAAPDAPLAELAHTAAAGRTHFAQRLALVAGGAAEARAMLLAWLAGEQPAGLWTGQAERASQPRVVFLCTGQGAQYAGMGRELYASQPVFRAAVDQCAEVLLGELGTDIRLIMFEADERRGTKDERVTGIDQTTGVGDAGLGPSSSGHGRSSLLDQTVYTQPALFVLGYALAQLWRSWGVEPAALVGHSVGEVLAAHLAGVFSLPDALRLIAARGRLMQERTQPGGMRSVSAAPEWVQAALAPFAGRLSLAAVNTPSSAVVAGEFAALDAFAAECAAQGVQTQPLAVSHAFHSPLMDPMLDRFEQISQTVKYQKPERTLISTLRGAVAGEEVQSAAYWREHARAPVLFAQGMQTLFERGLRVFVELGPRPTLSGLGQRLAAEHGLDDTLWLPSLRSSRPDWSQLLESLAALYVRGAPINWAGVGQPYGLRRVPGPTYPFQRQRFWIEAAPRPRALPAARLLGQRVRSPRLSERVFERELSAAAMPLLADHRVYGALVAPGALSVAMLLAALAAEQPAGPRVLSDLTLTQPLVLPEDGARSVQVILPAAGAAGAAQVWSAPPQADDEPWSMHAGARVGGPAPAPEAPPSLAQLQARCAAPVDRAAFYAGMEQFGFTLGPSFQWLAQLWCGEGEALGRLAEPPGAEPLPEGSLHPGLLDSCFQLLSAVWADTAETGDAFVPISIDQVLLEAPAGARPRWCHARLRPRGQGSPDLRVGDLWLADDEGRTLASVSGFCVKRAPRAALLPAGRSPADDWRYEVAWQPLPAAPAARLSGRWLVLADQGGLGAALAGALEARGQRVELLPAETDAAGLRAALEGGPCQGAVFAGALDTPDAPADALAAQTRLCDGALRLAQALLGAGSTARLWLLTRGAQTTDAAAAPPAPLQAALWGLGRVAAQEHPELRPSCLDLDPQHPAEAQARALAEELLADDTEDQLALRAGARHGARLLRRPAAEPAPTRLVAGAPGVLESLALQPMQRRAPGPGEVEIAVYASGLNFRDVINALGMYPGGPVPLGLECAGRIAAVGAGVEHLRVGDPVVAVAPDCFAAFVTVDAATVLPKPAGLSYAEAATIPITFTTAYRALHTLAVMRAGDRVLIHAAAGGVGMAAVQLAQQAGAEVYATAGSPEKRARLQALGVRHVFDSRTLDFSAQVRAASGGRGVDVVLNSLSGEFIPASLEALAPGGRFVEIGKIGIWDPAQVAAARPDVAYHLFALGQPDESAAMLRELVAQFERGALRPLPFQSFPLSEAAQVFRWMAQARHIGKIVLTQPEHSAPPAQIRPDGTYLVTGGLGGLGLRTAQWLVEQGARHLALLGRGAPAPAAQALIDGWAADGVRVHTLAADVADAAQLARALDDLRAAGPPLRGVVHAAGLLDDGVLAQQSAAQFARVLAPKAAGAWNLDRLTAADPLDFLVLFSSTAGLLGNPGQSNYAAANTTMDALALARRARGLPALSVSWGSWREVGMAARQSEREQRRWAELGIGLIGPDEGLATLGALLREPLAHVAVAPIQWARFLARFAQGAPPLFAALAQALPAGAPAERPAGPRLLQELEQAPAQRRRAVLLAHIRAAAARVLGLDPAQPLDSQQPLREVGLDSLMAVELRNALGLAAERALPVSLLFDYPTLEALAAYLAGELALSAAAAAPDSPDGAGQPAAAAEIQQLSEDEAEALLLKELDSLNY